MSSDLFVQIFTRNYLDMEKNGGVLVISANPITLEWATNGWVEPVSYNKIESSVTVKLTDTGQSIIDFHTKL